MTAPKHTPEPWQRIAARIFTCEDIPRSTAYCECADTRGLAKANAARIIACVNALEGIEDPAGFVEAARGLAAVLLLARLEIGLLRQHLTPDYRDSSGLGASQATLDRINDTLARYDATTTRKDGDG